MVNATDRAWLECSLEVERLEAENAALREYHAACERFFAQYKLSAFADEGTYAAVIYARETLRQYEESKG